MIKMRLPFVAGGGGALLYAHWGGAQCCADNGIFPSKWIGVSGGADAGGPIVGGMIPKDCLDIALEILPKNVMSLNWRMFQYGRWGIYSFKGLEKALSKYVPKRFSDCRIPFYVLATDLTTRKTKVYSPELTPKKNVAKAIVESSSVPIVAAFNKCDRTILTDGGVANNYPIDLVSGETLNLPKEKAIGFRLLSVGADDPKKPQNFVEAVVAVLGTMMAEIERKHIADASAWSKTISIEVPWNSLDFLHVNEEVIEKIYKSGYDAVKKKLESGWNPAETFVDMEQ